MISVRAIHFLLQKVTCHYVATGYGEPRPTPARSTVDSVSLECSADTPHSVTVFVTTNCSWREPVFLTFQVPLSVSGIRRMARYRSGYASAPLGAAKCSLHPAAGTRSTEVAAG